MFHVKHRLLPSLRNLLIFSLLRLCRCIERTVVLDGGVVWGLTTGVSFFTINVGKRCAALVGPELHDALQGGVGDAGSHEGFVRGVPL